MNFRLSILERICLMNSLLPKESNIVNQVLVEQIIKKTKIDQKEIEKTGLNFNDKVGGYFIENNIDKEIELSVKEITLLQKEIEILDKKNKITQQLLSVCLKIKEA